MSWTCEADGKRGSRRRDGYFYPARAGGSGGRQDGRDFDRGVFEGRVGDGFAYFRNRAADLVRAARDFQREDYAGDRQSGGGEEVGCDSGVPEAVDGGTCVG